MFALATKLSIFWAARVPHKRDEAICPNNERPDKEQKMCFSGEKSYEWNVIDCDSIYIAIGSKRKVWQRSAAASQARRSRKKIIHFNKYREKNQGRH